MNDNDSTEKLSVQGKTYIIKQRGDGYLLAFNGSKYLMVCKSKTFYVIAVCDSKNKHERATLWLRKLTNKLIEKNF